MATKFRTAPKIGEFDSEKVTISWDFSDTEPVLDKTGEFKQLFIDAITLLNGDVKKPIIRFEDIKILNEEIGKQAEVFHPFLDAQTITRDDKDLQEIMQKLKNTVEVDFDVPVIMGIPRNKALYILGFLFKKGFLECENTENQTFDLKLSERGFKVLGLRGALKHSDSLPRS